MVFAIIRAFALAIAVAAVMTHSALAADLERGQQLYENHCTGCHESQIHIRTQRKAQNPTELRWQIARWQEVLELPWTSVEVDDVQVYLNAKYYHYDTQQ